MANTNAKPDSSINIKELLLIIIIAKVFRILQDTTYLKYKLHSSVILDFKATLYIRNNKAHFTKLTLANNGNFLYTRDNYIRIEAYKIIKVIMQTNSYFKRRKIILIKATFILLFYISIISL
jgi:hypothetical protein